MSNEEIVYESPASYYDPSSRKWKMGIFFLNDRCIRFTYDDNETFSIPLKMLSALEKRQSSLIYPALVVSTNSEKHWFSSIPNRDSLYNLLELFWRETLLAKEHKFCSEKPEIGSTDLGKDLLNLIHESEATLVEAANALSDQGKQIEETQTTLHHINSDLNVAEKFLKEMSFPSSILKSMTVKSIGVAEQKEPLKCFKISYIFSDKQDESSPWNKGTLFVGEKIILIDDSKVNQLSVNYNEVIMIQVISRWKIHFMYSMDTVEKSCYIICPQLSKLLRFLSSLPSLSDKVSYKTCTSSTLTSYSSPSTSGFQNLCLSNTDEKSAKNSCMSTSEQLQENNDIISDEDIQELSKMLVNLQTLASEVNKEQQEQMEKINSLIHDVGKTELRMKADVKDIKKLI